MSANTEQRRSSLANWRVADPGNGGTIPGNITGVVPIRTAAAETRTVEQPVRPGLFLTVCMEVDGGDCTITCTNWNLSDDSFVFDTVGQYVVLHSFYISENTLGWEAIAGSVLERFSATLVQATDISLTGVIEQTQSLFATGGIQVGGVTADTGQGTNITTAVPIVNAAGTFNTQASTLAAGGEESFTMTNAGITEADICIINAKYNGSGGSPRVGITDVASGAFTVTITNEHALDALNGDFDINYFIIKQEVA